MVMGKSYYKPISLYDTMGFPDEMLRRSCEASRKMMYSICYSQARFICSGHPKWIGPCYIHDLEVIELYDETLDATPWDILLCIVMKRPQSNPLLHYGERLVSS